MSLEFKKISGSTPYLLNSASTAEELTLALEDYMRTGAQIIFTHDGEDCILSSFEYKSGIESTVIAYFISPKKKLVKVDVSAGFDLVITESGDFAEKKDITWENLPDKPFGETVVYGDTLTVDWAELEGKDLVTDTNNGLYVKVSDAVPTIDDCVNGCTIVMPTPDGVETVEIPYDGDDGLLTAYEAIGTVGYDVFVVAPSDNFAIGENVFPEKGVYFAKDSITSLTINGYKGFEGIVVKKIDEKYLPDYKAMIDEAIGNAIGGSY